MQRINNLSFNTDDNNYQDQQQRQVAALRDFYNDEPQECVVVDAIDVVQFEDHARVTISESNMQEVCDWLTSAKVYAAFKPVAVLDERGGVVLILQ